MGKFERRLHDLLVKAEVLTKERAEEGLEISGNEGIPYPQVLLERGLVKEGDLIGVLSEELNLPAIDLSKVKPSPEALATMTQDLALHYLALPVAKAGNVLTVAVADPFDIFTLDNVHVVTGCELRPVISTEQSVRQAIERAYSGGERAMEQLMVDSEDLQFELTRQSLEDTSLDFTKLTGGKVDAPIIKLVNLIIFQAVQSGASDVHIEPLPDRTRVRYRQDGRLRETINPPRRMHSAIVSRIKVMANCDIAEHRMPQDGKFQLSIEGKLVDFRVSVLPVVHGEKVVVRILDPTALSRDMDALGFEKKCLEDFRHAVKAPWGMVLLTGPTGCGKSTTLYAAVKEIISSADNFITVEDPVEYQIDGVNQVQVNPKAGLTFAVALRSILRQDPDKVMVGEIRDLETGEIAVRAALTGHLVMSTLHTNDAVASITRLVDMGVESFLVASSLLLVSAQRLARELCDACKEAYKPPKDVLISAGFKPEECKDLTLYRPKGCIRCTEGYKGRFGLLETLVIDDEMEDLILRGASAMELKKAALKKEMLSLRRCGILNAIRGRTSLEEVLSVTMID
ncbi:MAG: hypothetical protein AMS15_00310 [Planctomycetes bacterium DG_23]|nr:MAG: hypothetical protein AMS15_00310 [Planctomycetes bacterium DG_23]